MGSLCVTCKNPTADNDDEAISCAMFDNWECIGRLYIIVINCLKNYMRHLNCVMVELYCMYICTRCQVKGSIIKCLYDYEVDS